MKYNIYSIRDLKADGYIRPTFFGNDAEVTRYFGDGVKNPKTGLAAHPEDYELFCIGSFDDVTGEIKGCSPRYICRALDFVVKEISSGE